MGKASKVAVLLGTTESDARNFCLAVQREFIRSVPSYSTIADCLKAHSSASDNPAEIAQIIKQTHVQRVKPSRPVNSGKPHRGKGSPGLRANYADSETRPAITPQMGHDPRDATQGMDKCPHGVLRLRKCAICDPQGFRLQHGWD